MVSSFGGSKCGGWHRNEGADGQLSSHVCHTDIRYSRRHIATIISFLVILTLRKKNSMWTIRHMWGESCKKVVYISGTFSDTRGQHGIQFQHLKDISLRSIFRQVRKIAKRTISFFMSARPSNRTYETTRLPGGKFSWIWYLNNFRKMWRKLKFPYNLRRIVGTLHEYLCTFIIISRSCFLRMRNFTGKTCSENQNTFYIHQVVKKC